MHQDYKKLHKFYSSMYKFIIKNDEIYFYYLYLYLYTISCNYRMTEILPLIVILQILQYIGTRSICYKYMANIKHISNQ